MGKLGVFAGSGLEDLEEGRITLVSRHGRNHSIRPKDIDHRGNVKFMIGEGVTHALCVGAAGILSDYRVGDLVVIEDFIDLTPQAGFYGGMEFDSRRHHVQFHEPFDALFQSFLAGQQGVKRHGVIWHWPGDRFQTRAEALMMRGHANLVNMTCAREIENCVEAGLKVAAVCVATDDALKPSMKDIGETMGAARPEIVELIRKADAWVKEIG